MIDISYSKERAAMLVLLAEHDMYLQAICNMKEAGWQSATIVDIIKLSPEDKRRFGVTGLLVEQLTHVAKVTGLYPTD